MRKRQQSSQSDVQEDQNLFKITSNPGKIGHKPIIKSKYDESSESDISSLSQDQEDNQYRGKLAELRNNKKTIERQEISDSQSQSQQSSGIDLIEQRIKRLETDLEDKIDKQKKNQQFRRKEQIKSVDHRQSQKIVISKNGLSSNPPLPNKKIQIKQNYMDKQIINSKNSENQISENRNRMNIVEKQLQINKQSLIKQRFPQHFNEKVQYKQQASHKQSKINRVVEKGSQLNEQSKRKYDDLNDNIIINQSNSSTLLNKAHKQINELQAIIQSLKQQNQNLKDQLSKKSKKQKNQELNVLKIVASGDDLKLQKEIQTLKAIQSLQKKLKKSINKKLKLNDQKQNSMIGGYRRK